MVLVPPSWEGDRNDMALEAARTYPDRFAVMGRLALQDPASRALVADWRKQPGMLGMRFTFHNEHYRHFLTDGTADWLWPAAEKAGIPLMVLVPGALDHLDRIADAPSRPQARDRPRGHQRARQGAQGLRGAARGLRAGQAPERRGEGLGHAVALGPALPVPRSARRASARWWTPSARAATFWGTDLTRMPCTYYECITLFTQHLPWLKGEDLE